MMDCYNRPTFGALQAIMHQICGGIFGNDGNTTRVGMLPRAANWDCKLADAVQVGAVLTVFVGRSKCVTDSSCLECIVM